MGYPQQGLSQVLGLEPGEVHAVRIVNETNNDGEPIRAVEVRRKVDEQPFVIERSRFLKDVASFTAFCKRYGQPDKSLVLYDSPNARGTPKAVISLDEHVIRGKREFGIFRPECSAEWTRWAGFLGKGMDQKTLLDLLTDYALDVLGTVREIRPDGTIVVAPGGAADLRTALANISFSSKIDVKSVQNGPHDVSVSFSRADSSPTESQRIPTEFALSIPVFLGEQKRNVVIRLKTNDPTREDGDLRFTLKCTTWDDVARSAWDEMMSRVQKDLGTEFHVLRGDFGKEPGLSNDGSY